MFQTHRRAVRHPRRSARRGTLAAAVACAALVVAATSPPATAYPRPGDIERVSVASDGAEGDGNSVTPAVSADGRYVAFASQARNLVQGIDNSAVDVFVHDRGSGTTERVSVRSDGTEGNDDSLSPAISADGRYVAFESSASNFFAGDTRRPDVFLHDRETGTTEWISVDGDGTPGNAESHEPSISADGRYVAFRSSASNLVSGDTNGREDVFVRDRVAGTTERVSVANDGTEGNNGSRSASISADGRHVAFHSSASNLVPGDTNQTWDIFVRDREAGTTERVSVANDGTQANRISLSPSISADGRYVAFHSSASNLVPGDTNDTPDVFVRDRETATTERVSVASDGTEGNGNSDAPSISADGRYVAFDSAASNLVPDDTSARRDVFVRDRQAGTTERVSVAGDGTEANSVSVSPAIAADGRLVALESNASNLVPDDTNGRRDVFVRDRGPAIGVGGLSAVPDGAEISVSGWATFSGARVASIPDPTDDGAEGAEAVGAELAGAGLTYRPEQEDILVSLNLASLPENLQSCPVLDCLNTGAGAPAVVYGLDLELDGVRHEVRALRSAVTAAGPDFALYRCDVGEPTCTRLAGLTGGIGTTGPEVLVSLPLSILGLQEGATMQGLRAFTAVGEAATGGLVLLDEVELADVDILKTSVALGIAPPGTPAEQVAFDVEAALDGGAFSGAVETAALPAGEYEVWARACLGELCAAVSEAVELR